MLPKEYSAIKPERISEITEEIGYWRKANAIHRWFVENCQDGEDDCRDAHLESEKLKELLSICETIKADHSKAGELLPPTPGFFFGSQELNEGYFEDIEYTIELLKEVLADPKGDYYYHSSW